MVPPRAERRDQPLADCAPRPRRRQPRATATAGQRRADAATLGRRALAARASAAAAAPPCSSRRPASRARVQRGFSFRVAGARRHARLAAACAARRGNVRAPPSSPGGRRRDDHAPPARREAASSVAPSLARRAGREVLGTGEEFNAALRRRNAPRSSARSSSWRCPAAAWPPGTDLELERRNLYTEWRAAAVGRAPPPTSPAKRRRPRGRRGCRAAAAAARRRRRAPRAEDPDADEPMNPALVDLIQSRLVTCAGRKHAIIIGDPRSQHAPTRQYT